MNVSPNKITNKRKKSKKKKATRDTVEDDDAPQQQLPVATTPVTKEQDPADKKESGALKGQDAVIRKHITWITQTQQSVGLGEYFRENLQNYIPEKPNCATFMKNHKTGKNRYDDVMCVEETRVKLQGFDQPNSSDYIHANWIKFKDFDRSYIATQAPTKNSVEDFWRMVFYENVDTVVSILNPNEKTGENELGCYFPTETGKYAYYGKFFVNCRKAKPPTVRFTPAVYDMEVLPEGCSNSRFITVLNYPYWNEGSLPPSPRVILKIIRDTKTENSGPVVVQCDSGLNQTAMIILSDVIIALAFVGADFDIPTLFKQLRNQRASCFQHKFFFTYVCYTFLEYIRLRCKQHDPQSDLLATIQAFESSIQKDLVKKSKEPPLRPPTLRKIRSNATLEE